MQLCEEPSAEFHKQAIETFKVEQNTTSGPEPEPFQPKDTRWHQRVPPGPDLSGPDRLRPDPSGPDPLGPNLIRPDLPGPSQTTPSGLCSLLVLQQSPCLSVAQ